MMKLTTKLKVFEGDNFRAVTLPYTDSDLAMTIIHPDYEVDLNEFVFSLNDNLAPDFFDSFSDRDVNLWMPKFKLEYKHELSTVLKSMGMPSAFGAGADFTGITKNGGLFISRVLHNSFIQVDEQGTEAAAATAVEMKKSMAPARPLDVHVDSPFIFMIHNHTNDAILFIGKVMNPVWED